eukprot:6746289-Ditylum_brightwellii.AAC.1
MGFKQYEADSCAWKKNGLVIIVYIDQYLVLGTPKMKWTKWLKSWERDLTLQMKIQQQKNT